MNCWSCLGIEPTKDAAAVKRAYAARSRTVHPEDSPEEFRVLHEAYLEALAFTRQTEEAPMTTTPAFEEPPAPARSSTCFRELVYESTRVEAESLNAAAERTFARLEELSSGPASVDDFIGALGTAASVDSHPVRICFVSGFVPALISFIEAHEKLPDEFYEAVVLVYELSYSRTPPSSLRSLYELLKRRKRLMTRRERRLDRLTRIAFLTPVFFILALIVFRSVIYDVMFPLMLVMAVGILSACILSSKLSKPRDPGPFAEDLKKMRQRSRRT